MGDLFYENNGQGSFMYQLFPKTIFHTKNVPFLLICVITAIYIFQLILFYIIYHSKGYNWGCLLYQLGTSELSSVVNHYQYYRLITPLLTHNNLGHLLSNLISIGFICFNVEYALKKYNFLLLFIFSGITGNFYSLIFLIII